MVDVEKLAKLARIKLDTDEKEKLQKEFEAILGYVSKLNEADLNSLEGENAADIIGNKNVLREDGNTHESGQFLKVLLDDAPSKDGNYIKVKHVFN